MTNTILISYPSGGFGHFIYHALSCHGSNTYKFDHEFKFSSNGNSHSTKFYIKRYYKDPETFEYTVPDAQKISLILCDNGFLNDSLRKIKLRFPKDRIIRLFIDPVVRPAVYTTCVIKAMKSELLLENTNQIEQHWTDAETDYAKRENFTLFYHNWKFGWGPVDGEINVSIKELYLDPVNTISNLIKSIDCEVIDLDGLIALCNEWKHINRQYFEVYDLYTELETALENNTHMDISHVTDLHSQGYINYRLEKKFNITIPVFNYRDWFKNSDQIKDMVRKLHEEKYTSNI